jgi:hypothetical protein
MHRNAKKQYTIVSLHNLSSPYFCFKKINKNEEQLMILLISNTIKQIKVNSSFLTPIVKHNNAINNSVKGETKVKRLSNFVFKFNRFMIYDFKWLKKF